MSDVISSLKLLYKERKSLQTIQSEEQVREILKAELLDEYTHPRARLSIEKKFNLLKSKIGNSALLPKEQEDLVTILKVEYEKLSGENEK